TEFDEHPAHAARGFDGQAVQRKWAQTRVVVRDPGEDGLGAGGSVGYAGRVTVVEMPARSPAGPVFRLGNAHPARIDVQIKERRTYRLNVGKDLFRGPCASGQHVNR